MSKAPSNQLGAWLDRTIPDLCPLLKGRDLDHPAFVEWLAGKLGEFRFNATMRGQLEGRESDRQSVIQLDSDLRGVLHALAPGGLPPRVAVNVPVVVLKLRIADWPEVLDRLTHDLMILQAAIRPIADQWSNADLRKRAGRKRNKERDRLLEETAQQLMTASCGKKEAALDLAAQVLALCGIKFGVGRDALKSAARKGKQSR